MKRVVAVAVVVLVSVGRTAVAQTAVDRSFEIDPARDVSVAAALVGAAFLLDLNKRRWSETDPCRSIRRSPTEAERAAYAALPPDGGLCDPSEVLALDRWATELDVETAPIVSDVLLYSLLAAPLVFSGVDTAASGTTGERFGEDSVVALQALGATYLATVALKMAVARPRPLTYNPRFDKKKRFAGDARLSFPSGHASLSFAAASVLAVMLAERYGDAPEAYIGASGAFVAAATVASARVIGGKHFLTDVLAGAVLGTTLGLTIPLLHRRERSTIGTGEVVVGLGGAF